MMQNKLINLLEDIKMEKYSSYSDYLDGLDVENLTKWYDSFSLNASTDFETIISFIYELYVREDIDLRPYEDYKRIITYLANKYHFNSEHFLEIYKSYRDLLFK